jgi:hypothetical protein
MAGWLDPVLSFNDVIASIIICYWGVQKHISRIRITILHAHTSEEVDALRKYAKLNGIKYQENPKIRGLKKIRHLCLFIRKFSVFTTAPQYWKYFI